MIYQCDKKDHGVKHLLTRREKVVGPYGELEFCYIQTCQICIDKAVNAARDRMKAVVEASFR